MGERGCVFCDIVDGVGGAFVVYEDSHAVVFLDKRPINAGHVLVVPRRHVESFYALEEESFVGVMLALRRVAAAVEAAYRPPKVGMLAAGFDVAHAHLHVLPMYDYHDITSRAILEGTRAEPSGEELRTAAEHLRRSLRVGGEDAA